MSVILFCIVARSRLFVVKVESDQKKIAIFLCCVSFPAYAEPFCELTINLTVSVNLVSENDCANSSVLLIKRSVTVKKDKLFVCVQEKTQQRTHKTRAQQSNWAFCVTKWFDLLALLSMQRGGTRGNFFCLIRHSGPRA